MCGIERRTTRGPLKRSIVQQRVAQCSEKQDMLHDYCGQNDSEVSMKSHEQDESSWSIEQVERVN